MNFQETADIYQKRLSAGENLFSVLYDLFDQICSLDPKTQHLAFAAIANCDSEFETAPLSYTSDAKFTEEALTSAGAQVLKNFIPYLQRIISDAKNAALNEDEIIRTVWLEIKTNYLLPTKPAKTLAMIFAISEGCLDAAAADNSVPFENSSEQRDQTLRLAMSTLSPTLCASLDKNLSADSMDDMADSLLCDLSAIDNRLEQKAYLMVLLSRFANPAPEVQ